jgi:hypothetical protein
LSVGFYNIRKPVVQGDASKYISPGHLYSMQILIRNVLSTAGSESIDEKHNFQLVLFTDDVWLKNPGDYTVYFYPNARISVLDTCSPMPEMDPEIPSLVYLTGENIPEQLSGYPFITEVVREPDGDAFTIHSLIMK